MCKVLQYGICRRYYVTAERRWRPEWVGVKQTDWRHPWLVTGGMTTFDGLSALSIFSLLKHVPWLFLKLPSGDHPHSTQWRPPTSRNWSWSRMTLPTHDSSWRTFTTRDHPLPKYISGDSAASPSPSSRRRVRGGRSQPAASFQVLPPTTMWAGGRAIVLQYRRLRRTRVVTIYTLNFLWSARRMCVAERASDNLDTGSD